MQNTLCGINQVKIDLLIQAGLPVELLECLLDAFHRIDKIQDVGIFLTGIGAIQAAERLHRFHITQFLIDNHGMKKRFVKPGLVLFRNNKDVAFIVEHSLGLAFFHRIAVAVHVHVAFGIFLPVRLIRIFQSTTERNHDLNIIIVVVTKIFLNGVIVSNCSETGCSNNHHFALTADFLLGDIAEGFNDNSGLLLQIMRMQFLIPFDGLNRLRCRYIRVLRCIAGNLITHLISDIVRQHVQNKAFFNGLLHGVDMERMERPIWIWFTENLQSFALWRRSKRKEGKISVPSLRKHFLYKNILVIDFIFGLAFELSILLQGIFDICKSGF